MIVESLVHKLKMTVKTHNDNLEVLKELEDRCGYSHTYFSDQWIQQKRIQAEAMGDTNLGQLQDQLGELIEYEEELRDCR